VKWESFNSNRKLKVRELYNKVIFAFDNELLDVKHNTNQDDGKDK